MSKVKVVSYNPDWPKIFEIESARIKEALGYQVRGENSIIFRRLFQKLGLSHVHIFEQGNAEIEHHLKFRDWLCKSEKKIGMLNDKSISRDIVDLGKLLFL